MSESVFDSQRNYYVFRYVVDSVTGESTDHEGEIVAFTKASNPWEAVENAGETDMNKFGANRIDKLEDFEKAIADERKLLSKISKQLKVMTDEQDAEKKKFLEERPCPNGCGKMDSQHRCAVCGFGYEGEELIKNIENNIKDQKAKGEDTTQLEAFRDQVKSSLGL